jgi:hypothetical protein
MRNRVIKILRALSGVIEVYGFTLWESHNGVVRWFVLVTGCPIG